MMEMNDNNIVAYLHCSKCLEEMKADPELEAALSPKEYSKVQVGWTKQGLQVWCNRHECNIVHIDFEGNKHPADTTAKHDAPKQEGESQ